MDEKVIISISDGENTALITIQDFANDTAKITLDTEGVKDIGKNYVVGIMNRILDSLVNG